jgi:hypothetical protein
MDPGVTPDPSNDEIAAAQTRNHLAGAQKRGGSSVMGAHGVMSRVKEANPTNDNGKQSHKRRSEKWIRCNRRVADNPDAKGDYSRGDEK